jgi:DNA-directed RNA polymerase specialized sigma24 family protein
MDSSGIDPLRPVQKRGVQLLEQSVAPAVMAFGSLKEGGAMARPGNPFGDESRAYRESSDEELVAACVGRKPGALDEFFRRHTPTIKLAADLVLHSVLPRRITLDEDDLYQVFCLQMLRRKNLMLGQFVAPRPLEPLLFIVALRVMRRAAQAKGACIQDQFEHPEDDALSEFSERAAGDSPASVKVAELLDRIDEKLRKMVQIYYGLECAGESSYAETAEQMHCSVWQAFRAVQRALAELRDIAKALKDEATCGVAENPVICAQKIDRSMSIY